MQKFKVEVNVSYEFSDEDINDLISTALEGGITYWCGKAEIKLDENLEYLGVNPEDRSKVQLASDVISVGGTLILEDAEEEDKRWELTPENMLKGIAQYCKEQKIAPEDLMDNYDAGTADMIIQYALFNEQVFG